MTDNQSSDIVERLREGIDPNDIPEGEAVMDKAADEIERLRMAARAAIEAMDCINLDWGKVVQVILRCMDTSSKGESSAEVAKRMANSLFAETERIKRLTERGGGKS